MPLASSPIEAKRKSSNLAFSREKRAGKAICFSFSGEKSRLRYGLLFEYLQGLQKFCAQHPSPMTHSRPSTIAHFSTQRSPK
ncbi:MAG TPA: hypothetical protein VGH25_02210, partial [Dongiaceae bacterium]